MVAFNDTPPPEPGLPDVDLRPRPFPVRSLAFSLKPLAVGTGMVESLWGYLVRLAAAHHLRMPDFFWGIVAPLAEIQQPRRKMAYVVPLKGERALRVSLAVETITIQTGLDRATLVRADRFSCVDVKTRDRRAWCPSCLGSGAQQYDLLLWHVTAVTRCPIHQTPLHVHCPACRRRQRFGSPGVSIGRCAYCGSSLTDLAGGGSLLPDDYQDWKAKQVAHFIAHFHGQNKGDPAALSQNLKNTMKVFGGRKPLARVLRVALNSLRSWERGITRMNLEVALRWAWVTDMPIADLLCHEIPRSEFKIRPSRAEWVRPVKAPRKTPSAKTYLTTLACFLGTHPYAVPTKCMLVQRAGGNKKLPSLNTPEVVCALKLSQRARRLLRRRQMVWAIVCRVHRAFTWAKDRGLPLNSGNICLGLGRGGDMVSPLARKYFSVLKLQYIRGHVMPDPKKRVPQDVLEFWTYHGLT